MSQEIICRVWENISNILIWDRILETYTLLKLNWEYLKTQNNPVTGTDLQTTVKTVKNLSRKNPGPHTFTAEFY